MRPGSRADLRKNVARLGSLDPVDRQHTIGSNNESKEGRQRRGLSVEVRRCPAVTAQIVRLAQGHPPIPSSSRSGSARTESGSSCVSSDRGSAAPARGALRPE